MKHSLQTKHRPSTTISIYTHRPDNHTILCTRLTAPKTKALGLKRQSKGLTHLNSAKPNAMRQDKRYRHRRRLGASRPSRDCARTRAKNQSRARSEQTVTRSGRTPEGPPITPSGLPAIFSTVVMSSLALCVRNDSILPNYKFIPRAFHSAPCTLRAPGGVLSRSALSIHPNLHPPQQRNSGTRHNFPPKREKSHVPRP